MARRKGKNNVSSTIRRLCLCAVVTAFALSLMALFTPSTHALYSAAQINSRLPGGSASLPVHWDNVCYDRMAANLAAGQTERTAINTGGSYAEYVWISQRGAPSVVSMSVPYGTTSVPLQINQVTFICSPLVNPASAGARYPRTAAQVVQVGNAPNDRRPNTSGSSINIPARLGDASRILSVGASWGSVSGVTGTQNLISSRDANSRYWFASAPINVTYNTGSGGITSAINVNLTVNRKTSSQYGAGWSCKRPGGPSTGYTPAGALDFNPCETVGAVSTITLRPSTTPARYQPGMSVNGAFSSSAASYAYINPSQRATFRAWNSVGSYNGMNHAFTGMVQRTYVSTGNWTGWQNIHQGSYTATGNGNTTFWGDYNIGPGTTQGGNQRSPDNLPANLREVCYRFQITNAGGAILNPPNPTQNACARVRAGNTVASSSATPANIEKNSGETATIVGSMTTTGFRDWGDPGGNYGVTCSYSIALTAGSGAGSNNGTIGGGATSGSCNQTISSNGTINFVSRTYTSDANTRIGSRACITVTLTASDFVAAANRVHTSCTTVVAKPYLKVVGGDVIAGKGFSPSCTAETSRIVTWNRGATYNYRGAGTTYAAIATGAIDGFSSAQFAIGESNPAYGDEPRGLTFANTSGTYGGNYAAAGCIPDYYGTRPATPSATSWPGWNTANGFAAANSDGTVTYNVSGNLTLTGGTITAGNASRPGSNIRLYVDGDVYINGNITAENPSVPGGATNAVYYTPNFLLVARGNIYVASGVTQLYGSFAAQPNGTAGGNFYTCASGMGTPLALSAANFNTCGSQLTITGGVAAKKLHLLRTAGTMSQDAGGQLPYANNGGGYANAAEVFVYNPVLWLRQLTGTTGGSSAGGTYDAMTTLPPVL